MADSNLFKLSKILKSHSFRVCFLLIVIFFKKSFSPCGSTILLLGWSKILVFLSCRLFALFDL